MNLKIENVGKIDNADIELNGITVIAGENNTGKSTIGKVLFCIYNSFFRMDGQILDERINVIAKSIFNFYFETVSHFDSRIESRSRKFARYIVEKRKALIGDKIRVITELEEFYSRADGEFKKYYTQETIEQLAEKISTFLKVEDNDIRIILLRRRLSAEFDMKIGNLNMPEKKTRVCLRVKNSKVEFNIEHNEKIELLSYMNMLKEIIYIDNPFVLDSLNMRLHFRYREALSHQEHLLEKLAAKRTGSFSALEELVVNEHLENIFETMKGVCDGELQYSEDGNGYTYVSGKFKSELNIVNLSTGIKSFTILKTLLQNGSIGENGVVILDEPEIHLHPEWQLKFAEIIVMLQKEFGVHILLNTHSPYFLNAIQVFAEKHDVVGKCKYYMTQETEGKSEVLDVTDNTEKIYEKLARPLQELENLEYRYGHRNS